MKTIVLMGISCLLLVGVYGVMNKEQAVSNALSFNQSNGAVSPIDTEDRDNKTKVLPTDIAEHKTSASNTLDDSHWIDDPLFEKAAESDLITDSEVDLAPQTRADPETIKTAPQGEENLTAPTPEIKQLILELEPDSAAGKQIPVEVI
ncbi:hypothetical protein [Longitalea arenae]|uniref:hypothetical protein n=1 Tax=Longitalea arenae TaxID=2812558 RepID=UPI00196742B0|nr:hypothetical protein [Longitalea arenae]